MNEWHKDFPLIVAQVRDERYDRQPSTVPCLIDSFPIAVVAPIDVKTGGTWIGVTQTGWFASLTNQDEMTFHTNVKSRGKLMMDIVKSSQHVDAARMLTSLDPSEYNSFNVVFGRPGSMFMSRVHHDMTKVPRQVDAMALGQGIHVVTNDETNIDAYAEKKRSLTQDVEKFKDINSHTALHWALRSVLASHNPSGDPYQSMCVHDAAANNFGSVSSAIITVDNEGEVKYWHLDGQPCEKTNRGMRCSFDHHPVKGCMVPLLDDVKGNT